MPSEHVGSAHESFHGSTTHADPNPASGSNHMGTEASRRGDVSPPAAGLSTSPRVIAGNSVQGVSRSQPRNVTSAGNSIPARYIAKPVGDLQSDPAVPGTFVNGGLRYAQSGGNWYGISYDRSNGTWRVVRHDELNKPGIPVKLNANGTLAPDTKVGLRGGGGSEEERARAQASVSAKRNELQSKQADIAAKDRELNSVRSANDVAKGRIAELSVTRHKATQRLDRASTDVSESERKLTQATQEYQTARDRYNAAQASSSAQQDDLLAFARSQLPPGRGPRMTSVYEDGSLVRDAEQQQRQYQDNVIQSREEKRRANDDFMQVDNELRDAWRNHEDVVRQVSALENDRAALEGQRLTLERELKDLEREQSRLA